MLSTDEILAGLGLAIVLGISSQLVASRLHIPAIVLLLPVGFVAGAITNDVNPNDLFGATFQPLVSLGVALILFEAGMRLRLTRQGLGTVVTRLVTIGVAITFVGITIAAKLIFGLDWGVCVVLGAILVVSGPTVVGPLLSFVRPTPAVREVLKWEGTLIDPLGALLGVAAFTAVRAGGGGNLQWHFGDMISSFAVGAAVGLLAAAVLFVLVRELHASTPGLAIPAVLMCVAGALVGADLIREDSGFVAAAIMGAALANQGKLDVGQILEFEGTVVTLLISVLFILISASVSPSDVKNVLGESLLLIAVMVFVLRPLVVAIATWGSKLSMKERAFVAWMAPRGIVAAATGSAFGLELAQAGVSGAGKILPIAFVVIFVTVVLYGLTAVPVARLLGVAGPKVPLILVVGGNRGALAISRALKEAGARVQVWTRMPAEQKAAQEAGLELGTAHIGIDRATREAELEEVGMVLVMTPSDDFNVLAAHELRHGLGTNRVFELAPQPYVLEEAPAYAYEGILFDRDLTYDELNRRLRAGARVEQMQGPAGSARNGATPLFVLGGDGDVRPITAAAATDEGEARGRLICLTGA